MSAGFPVKIQIPIGLIIKAEATFNKFEFLTLNPSD
jgi:GPCR-chaperone